MLTLYDFALPTTRWIAASESFSWQEEYPSGRAACTAWSRYTGVKLPSRPIHRLMAGEVFEHTNGSTLRAIEDTARWLGPFPSVDLPPQNQPFETEDGEYYSPAFEHPGGPAPAFGGYRPVLRYELPNYLAYAFGAHTSRTRLYLVNALPIQIFWLIEAPHRHSRRAVNIAMDALRAGFDCNQLLRLGLYESEIIAGIK